MEAIEDIMFDEWRECNNCLDYYVIGRLYPYKGYGDNEMWCECCIHEDKLQL